MSSAVDETRQNGPRSPQPLRLALPPPAVKRLDEAGIYCRPMVSVEYQVGSKRSVVRGLESGGSVRELGQYVLFCDEGGRAIPWLQPVHSIGANGLHAVVIAAVLVSVEIFRVEQTYELLIAKHEPRVVEDGRKSRLSSEVVFRGRQGYLSLELWARDREAAGRITPEFFTRAGERREIPPRFVAAVMAATKGVTYIGCDHSQYAYAPGGNAAEAPVDGEAHRETELAKACSE